MGKNAEYTKQKQNGKNLEIECYRFLATAAVAVLHFSEDYTGSHGIINGGYLGVDFFFMLSGYFLMQHWLKQERGGMSSRNAAVYFCHRLRRLYPPFLIATVLMQLTQWAFGGYGVKSLISGFWKIRWQFLMCQHLGAPVGANMRSIWYLSSLVFLTWLIYFLIDRDLDLFLGIAPVADVLIFVYIFRTFGKLSMWNSYNLIFYGGILRGFAEMTLGAIIAYMVCEARGKKETPGKGVEAIRVAVRVCCWFLIGFVMVFRGFDDKDFVVIPAMAVLLAVAEMKPIISGGVLAGGLPIWEG